jgi:hypothetical protein
MVKRGLLMGFALCSLAFADVIVFNSPTGDLGSTTHNYTLDGFTITATGFNGGDLFGKNGGSDEAGLGLANDPSGDHEIFFNPTGAPQDFIQLDLLNLINAGFSNFQFQMNSTTGTEGWSVSACSVSGTDCFSSPVTGTDENGHNAPVSLSKTNHFLDFSSTDGNVLLHSLSATAVPEPQFYGFLTLALVGLAALRSRRSA